MQILEIKTADIPDVDLTRLGVTKYGNFTVEIIDPVADYLELMEVRNQNFIFTSCICYETNLKFTALADLVQYVFDFSLISSLLSRPDFRYFIPY